MLDKIIGTENVGSTSKKKNVIFEAIKSVTISYGIISVVEIMEGNRGIRDILKSKLNLSMAGLFVVFDIGRAINHNRAVDTSLAEEQSSTFTQRIEQEKTDRPASSTSFHSL